MTGPIPSGSTTFSKKQLLPLLGVIVLLFAGLGIAVAEGGRHVTSTVAPRFAASATPSPTSSPTVWPTPSPTLTTQAATPAADSGRPDASNTGVPSDQPIGLVVDSSIVSGALPGSVTSPAGCATWGGVHVTIVADNCVLHNVRVIGGTIVVQGRGDVVQYAQVGSLNGYPADQTNGLIDLRGATDALIEDSEVGYGNKGGHWGILTDGDHGSGSTYITIERVNVHHNSHDVQIFGGASNIKLLSNYIWGDIHADGAHVELVYGDNPANTTFQGNSFYWSGLGSNSHGGGGVAEVFTDHTAGAASNLTFDNNWWDADPNAPTGPPNFWVQIQVTASCVVTNNQFGTGFNLTNGTFYIYGGVGSITRKSNNVWLNSGAANGYGTVTASQPVPGLN